MMNARVSWSFAVVLTSCLLLVSFPAWAKGEKKAKPKAEAATPKDFSIQVQTVFGERTGEFVVDRKGKDAKISLTTNAGIEKQRALSAREVDFILKSLKSLPVNHSIPNDCYRSKMEIQTEGIDPRLKQLNSCFGVKTKTSGAYTRFASILATAF